MKARSVGYVAGFLNPYEYESITVSTTAVGLTATKYYPSDKSTNGQARLVYITVETDEIRFRVDGTAPTATEGHYAQASEEIILVGVGQIKNFKAIADTGASGDATIRVTYFR